MSKYIVKLLTFWIPVKKLRKKLRIKLNLYFYNTKACKKELPLIQKALETKDYAFALITIAWDSVLYQRPQHFSCQLSHKEIPVFYSGFSTNEHTKIIKENIYQISAYTLFNLPSELAEKIYLIVTNIHPLIDVTTLMNMKKKGYKIIYDYIDDFNEKILGDNKVQLEVFNRLEDIDPVLIIASAKNLYHQMVKRFGPKKVIMTPNGVEIENFLNTDKRPLPSDMKAIKQSNKPIVGYYGAMAPWLDWKLINMMHKKCKDYEFVYIGLDYQKALKNLIPARNVHFLGPKSYKELPDYAAHFDCCIIPFIEGDIAKSTSPLKLYEFMAMKKTVVCTKDLLECFGYEGVFISESDEKFIENLKLAIQAGKNKEYKKKLFEQACANTWESRVAQIMERLNVI